jgi:predicted protein tyrosine phosphatase
MPRLLISSFAAMPDTIRRHRPSHLLSLMDEHVETPAAILPGRHFRIRVHDICEPAEGAIAPCATHIDDILAFARSWTREAPFLVHCWAGVSRSTAAAYILLCDVRGPGQEAAIARELREFAPHAQPNRLMVRHADQILAREGRMIAAVEAMGEARLVWEADVVQMRLLADDDIHV